MITVDSKQGIAIYTPKSLINSGRLFPFIEESMYFLTREGITHFIIDLTYFSSLTTNELHVLMKLGSILPVQSVSIVGIESSYRKILTMSGLDKMFGVFSNTAEAVNAIICEKEIVSDYPRIHFSIPLYDSKAEFRSS